jgi:hypothetical protein
MARTIIVKGRIYEETGERTVIVGGGIFEGTVAVGWSVSDVDTDESISDGQTSVVVTLTGTVAASGKLVWIEQGGTWVQQTVTAEAAQTVTFTCGYGALTAGAANLYVRNPI